MVGTDFSRAFQGAAVGILAGHVAAVPVAYPRALPPYAPVMPCRDMVAMLVTHRPCSFC
jgi:hypothetical protein